MEDSREYRNRTGRSDPQSRPRRRPQGPDGTPPPRTRTEPPRRPAEGTRRAPERTGRTEIRRPSDGSGRRAEAASNAGERAARAADRPVRTRERADSRAVITPVEETARARGPEQSAASSPRREDAAAVPRRKKRRPHRIRNTNFRFKFLTMLAVVAVLILGLIIFFKVRRVQVVGNEYYTAQQIIDSSGVHIDDNLLSLSKASVSANIHKSLHYVEEVQIKKKLPGTVIIIVKEAKVTYGIQDRAGSWWLIDKNCKVLDSADAQSVKDHTVIKGLQIQPPEPGQQIKPAAADGADLAELSAKESALEQLLPLLEENPLAQSIVTVDLSTSYDIILWYETKYEIRLGTSERLEDKLQFLRSVVDKLKDENGAWTVDLSFTMGETVIASPRN